MALSLYLITFSFLCAAYVKGAVLPTSDATWATNSVTLKIHFAEGKRFNETDFTSRMTNFWQSYCDRDEKKCGLIPTTTEGYGTTLVFTTQHEVTPGNTTQTNAQSTLPPQTPEPTLPPQTPEPTLPPQTPEPTLPPQTPEPTLPPQTPEPTVPPQTPEPTLPPQTPEPTLPPQTPEPTVPPQTPEPTVPPQTPEPTVPPQTPEPTLPPQTPEPTLPPQTPEPTVPPQTPEPTLPPQTPEPTISPPEPQADATNEKSLSARLFAVPLSTKTIEVKVLLFKPSSDEKSVTVEFVVLATGTSVVQTLDRSIIQNVVKSNAPQISKALEATNISYIEPATESPNPAPKQTDGTTPIIVVVVLAMLVILLVVLVMVFQKRRAIQGNQFNYLNQPSQQQQFDNAAFDNKNETVQIGGSFDRT